MPRRLPFLGLAIAPRSLSLLPCAVTTVPAFSSLASHPRLQTKRVSYSRFCSRILFSAPLVKSMSTSAPSGTSSTATQTNGYPAPHAGKMNQEEGAKWSVAKGMS
ncbi:hypothetical protein BU23DRAFT_548395 [Bimuria novae-zelandiae CBS 107.79]|uniref:Uncharacterized protein n=1 Tax=Bimuria novae-zelandiae CBS 107.79 TaxID=1447943 RepID=A0A6A5VUG4_9PLEO|nr:hypothetical protein BU23DRAFT_548395 [Bimuria novae-zelandiae CBS 107.79]